MHIDQIEKWDGKSELWVVSPKGTNGAGKSSIAHKLIKDAGDDVVPVYWPEKFSASRKGDLQVATLLPSLGWVILGSYKSQCGGCDILKLLHIQEVLFKLWKTNYHIFYEGAMVAHTKETYPLYHSKLNAMRGLPKRRQFFPFLFVHPFESVRRAIGRGSARSVNGVLMSKVLEKFNGTCKWKDWYDNLKDTVSIWIDTHLGFDYVFARVWQVIYGGNEMNLELKIVGTVDEIRKVVNAIQSTGGATANDNVDATAKEITAEIKADKVNVDAQGTVRSTRTGQPTTLTPEKRRPAVKPPAPVQEEEEYEEEATPAPLPVKTVKQQKLEEYEEEDYEEEAPAPVKRRAAPPAPAPAPAKRKPAPQPVEEDEDDGSDFDFED